MTYINCKKLITSGNYEKVQMSNMLDVFLLRNRITQVQYNELMDLIESTSSN